MTNATCPKRPRRYHTRRGFWVKPLLVLARHGYADHTIAQVLQDLSRDALLTLARMDHPSADDVEALRETDMGPRWTGRQVRHHRRSLGVASRVKRHLSLVKWWARGALMIGRI